MIRYRCPHCAALLVAHERRAGQSTVCRTCLKPHPIPSDEALWLTETGEPLHPPAAAPAEQPSPTPEPVVEVEDGGVLAPAVAEPEIPEPVVTAPVVSIQMPVLDEETAPLLLPPRPSVEAVATTVTPPPLATPPRSPPVPVEPPRAEPVQAQTQTDIAVALSAALASRMKQLPALRRDLRPSTALWILSSGAALALMVLGLFVDSRYLVGALILGLVQLLAGYLWIVRLTSARNTRRGLLCAIPPATLYFLMQYKYAKWRPLRFFTTGVLLTTPAAFVLGDATLPLRTQRATQNDEQQGLPPLDPASMSQLNQLRYYREQKDYDAISKLLDVLAKTDPHLSADANDRAAFAVELKALCHESLSNVKVRAMAAYARWDSQGARIVCLAAVRSPRSEERLKALELLPQWKDVESARAVQSLIGWPGAAETARAEAALKEIGGPPAEQAAIVLLNRADSQLTKLTALMILAKVGSADTAATLRNYAMAASDPAVRAEALAAAEAIESRIPATGP